MCTPSTSVLIYIQYWCIDGKLCIEFMWQGLEMGKYEL